MDRVRICVQRDAAAIKRDGAPIGRVHAEKRQCELGSARTEQTGEAHDFSGAQLQAHIVIVTIATEALDLEYNRARGKIARLYLIFKSLPGHQVAEFAAV